MSNVSTDRNYTDKTQSGVDATTERVGDSTGEPATNETTDRDAASKMANLLEGYNFRQLKKI